MKQLTIRGNSAGWGSNFIRIIDHLIWCDENNIAPYIELGRETECFYDGSVRNIWELFFDSFKYYGIPNQISLSQPAVRIDTNFRHEYCLSYENRKKGFDAFAKWILPAIKPSLMIKINELMKTYELTSNNFTSLHIRGTDWYECEVKTLRSELFPLERFYNIIKDLYNPDKKLFVMSDNLETILYMKDKFHNVVFYKDATRAEKYKGPSVHPSWNNNNIGNPKLAEDVIIESLIASQSESFIHSEGNTDLIVLLMNPNLKSKYIKTI